MTKNQFIWEILNLVKNTHFQCEIKCFHKQTQGFDLEYFCKLYSFMENDSNFSNPLSFFDKLNKLNFKLPDFIFPPASTEERVRQSVYYFIYDYVYFLDFHEKKDLEELGNIVNYAELLNTIKTTGLLQFTSEDIDPATYMFQFEV